MAEGRIDMTDATGLLKQGLATVSMKSVFPKANVSCKLLCSSWQSSEPLARIGDICTSFNTTSKKSGGLIGVFLRPSCVPGRDSEVSCVNAECPSAGSQPPFM